MDARLKPYRDLGAPGSPYPPWVRALAGHSGVYVIRSTRNDKQILYVGESHSGRLYETLTRHVQRWNLPEAHSYDRGAVDVAVRVTSAEDAPALQREYICSLQPRDNIYEVEGCDVVPF